MTPSFASFIRTSAAVVCFGLASISVAHGDDHEKHAEAAAPSASPDAVVATVNGTNVTQGDLDFHMQRNPSANAPGGREKVIEELVDSEVLYQKAIADGLDKDAKTVTMLANIRRAVLAQSLVRKYLEAHPVTEADIKAEYDNKVKNAPSEFKARHILVKEEAEAKKIVAALDKGGDFAKLADEKTQDPSGKANGGDLGWFPAGQMVPEFTAAVEKLEKGKYTKAPVKTQFGWHVILLEDKRTAAAPDFAASKQEIEQSLQQKQVEGFVKGLHKAAKIELKK